MAERKVGMNKQMREDARLPEAEAAGMWGLIREILHDQSPATAIVKDHLGVRTEERISCGLPVDLGTATGVTRDISASGVFFETDATYPLSSSIQFQVEVDTPTCNRLVTCHGEVVRIEPRNKKVGVAVKVTEALIEPA